MIGIKYKDTFAAKGSQLYAALTDGNEELARRTYAVTTAQGHAVLHGLKVPNGVLNEVNGKQVWHIHADDAEYNNQGRFVRLKEKE